MAFVEGKAAGASGLSEWLRGGLCGCYGLLTALVLAHVICGAGGG